MGKLTEIEGHHQHMGWAKYPNKDDSVPPSCAILPIASHWQILLLSDLFFLQTNCAPLVVNTSVGGCLAFSHWSQLFGISSLLAAACVCFALPPIQSKHTIACD